MMDSYGQHQWLGSCPPVVLLSVQVMSYGMVLCASDAAHEQVEPVAVPDGVPVGEKVSFEGYTGTLRTYVWYITNGLQTYWNHFALGETIQYNGMSYVHFVHRRAGRGAQPEEKDLRTHCTRPAD